MKKILLATRPLSPPWDEASKNFAYFLAKSIKDPSLEMHILTTSTPLDGLSDNVLTHPIFPLYDATRAGHSFVQKAILLKYLFTKSHTYDIVHYLFTPTVLNSKIIQFGNKLQQSTKKFKTIQTIATLREDLYGSEDWKRMFFADKLVVYSDYSKHKLEEAEFANVTRIYPGIDLALYSPQPKDEATMKHFNIAPDDFVLSYFGEYARLGATDTLVEMLIKYLKPSSLPCHPELVSGSPKNKEIPKQVRNDLQQNIKFIFACRVKNDADQKKKDEVIKKLTEASIIDRVRFSDTFKDMPKLYNLTDIVLFPVENMRGKFDIPLVIIEAYACGKPVIVTDLPIFQEFTNDTISAIIPTGDGDVLWKTIEYLQLNEAKCQSLGQAARYFTEELFDLKNTTKAYETLYSEI